MERNTVCCERMPTCFSWVLDCTTLEVPSAMRRTIPLDPSAGQNWLATYLSVRRPERPLNVASLDHHLAPCPQSFLQSERHLLSLESSASLALVDCVDEATIRPYIRFLAYRQNCTLSSESLCRLADLNLTHRRQACVRAYMRRLGYRNNSSARFTDSERRSARGATAGDDAI